MRFCVIYASYEQQKTLKETGGVIVPFILRFAYDIETPIPLMMLTVGLGEVCSCGVLGLILYRILYRHKEKLFGYVEENSKQD